MATSQEQRNKYIAESNEEYEILHDVSKKVKTANGKSVRRQIFDLLNA